MIRIGIIGCGRILAAHLRGYRLLREAGFDDFRITALCARDPADALSYLRPRADHPQRAAVSRLEGDPLAIGEEYLASFQETDDVWIGDDFRTLITSGRVDAINDLTPHGLHHQVSGLALRQGLHTLTQKPLAITVAAARQLCRLAESRQVVFGVFENFRFLEATRQLRWLLEPEQLGPLEMALFGYVGAWWAPDLVVADTPWRHRRSEGGGIALDLGVHFFDQLRFAAGEIDTVSARVATIQPRRRFQPSAGSEREPIECDAEDTCLAHFRLQGGAVGSLAASWAGAGQATQFGPGSVYYAQGGRFADGLVTRADGTQIALDAWYRQSAPAAECEQWFPAGLTDSFALAQHDWLEAIRRRRQGEMNGAQGLADLAAAYALLESAHLGQEVRVAEVLAGTVEAFQRPWNRQLGIAG